MAVEGVDYAFAPHPSIQGLADAGKKFACRYGGTSGIGPGTASKWLTIMEARALADAGLWIAANAEGSTSGLLGGYEVGKSWAAGSDACFKVCGMPADRPIYLSVDFDVTAAQWPQVREALRGAADALGGVRRVGVYGGRNAIAWARRDGVATWYWQTYGWSGGLWVPGNHVEQYRNNVIVAGAPVDLNRALVADYGQWKPGISGGGDDMKTMLVTANGGDGRVWLSNGITRIHVANHDTTDKTNDNATVLRDTQWVNGANVLGSLIGTNITGVDDLDAFGKELPADLAKRLGHIEEMVAALVPGAGIDLDALAAKIAALMPKPATPAEISAVVNAAPMVLVREAE